MQLIKITGTKMEQENVSLFALYNEKVNKSRKLKELKEEIEYNKSMKKYKDVRQKLELLTSMVNVMTESQEKINSKRTATIVRLQQDLHSSSLTAEKENILLVPQKKQKYLKNIVKNKESIENLFCSVQNHDFNNSCLKATEDAQNIAITWNKQLAQDINLFKASKGLYTNVVKMQNTDLDKSFQEDNIENELGCQRLEYSSSTSTCDDIGFEASSPVLLSNASSSNNSAKHNIRFPSDTSSITEEECHHVVN